MNYLKTNYDIFESIKHIDESGHEYWLARELMPLLEYSKWERFSHVIDNAKITCNKSGYREEEILEYLEKNEGIESFVIIDDECTDLKKFINNELIHVKNDCTSFDENNNGLLEMHVVDAINRLNYKKYVKSIK